MFLLGVTINRLIQPNRCMVLSDFGHYFSHSQQIGLSFYKKGIILIILDNILYESARVMPYREITEQLGWDMKLLVNQLFLSELMEVAKMSWNFQHTDLSRNFIR
jgi:hypothetical protein